MHICIQRFYFISSLTVPRLNFDLAANLRVYEGGCSWNENDPLQTGQAFVKKLGEFVRRAAGTFPWPVYDQASHFFFLNIFQDCIQPFCHEMLSSLSAWSRMCQVLYVLAMRLSGQSFIWPRVSLAKSVNWSYVYLALRVSGPACIWPCVYLALRVSGPACIWPCVYLATRVSGPACIWPRVYLAVRLSGHACIWLCLYLGHARFWWSMYSGCVRAVFWWDVTV